MSGGYFAKLNLFCFYNNHLIRSIIISATFLPDMSIPPKIGPIRGVPETADAAIPQTYSPGYISFVPEALRWLSDL